MRVLVIGAGRTGGRVIRQLQKNPKIAIITLDPRVEPYALEEGIIPAVDIRESLTPLNMEFIMEKAQPDLVLLAMTSDDLGLGSPPGMDVLAGSLREELAAISQVPMIEVARTGS